MLRPAHVVTSLEGVSNGVCSWLINTFLPINCHLSEVPANKRTFTRGSDKVTGFNDKTTF